MEIAHQSKARMIGRKEHMKNDFQSSAFWGEG
jgi:hypothetical protein